jgi:hypothetical protein
MNLSLGRPKVLFPVSQQEEVAKTSRAEGPAEKPAQLADA